MTDDEDEDDLNDFDEDESSQASTSSNATTDRGTTSSSSSSKHSHCHPNTHHHPCGNKETCEEKGDKEHSGDSGKGSCEKRCLCCYCEVYGHGRNAAPVSKNYPEMRDRLRLLLSKKNKCNMPKSQPAHRFKCESGSDNDPNKISSKVSDKKSSKLSNKSSTCPIVAKGNQDVNFQQLAQIDVDTTSNVTALNKKTEEYSKLQGLAETQVHAKSNPKFKIVSEIRDIPTRERVFSKISQQKNKNLSSSSSKSSVVSETKRSASNPIGYDNQTESTNDTKEMPPVIMPNGDSISNAAGITENELKPNSKIKDVEELLDFIEGNQRAAANDKKKAKKERQKQQKIEELRKKEDEARRIKEEKEKERLRMEQEKKKRDEEERLRIKKINKKAAQKAKKVAAKGGTISSSPLLENTKDIVSATQDLLQEKVNDGSDPVKTLEHLKAQHLKELQDLQILHRQQLEEEQKKLLKKQGAQQFSQFQQLQQGTPSQLNKKKGKMPKNADSKKLVTNLQESKSNIKLSNSVQASAYKTLAEASKNPGNQIKITRMPNGGVEFSTVPVGQEHNPSQALPTSVPPMMTGQNPAPPPYLQDMYSRNPSMQPHTPQPMAPQNSQTTSHLSENVRPCVPSLSNQPMVTIRRVESSGTSDPTVTISMKEKDRLQGREGLPNFTQSNTREQDKLLYTIVNGKVLKSSNAPENLLPQASIMPTNAKMYHQKGNINSAVASSTSKSTSFVENSAKSSRPPLPLDSCGKIDLNRLELPSGISITKIEGQAPERKYFPSKPSEQIDPNILPFPGQHKDQRGVFSNSPTKSNGINSLQPSAYSVDSLGQYNIPGIGPTNPNNVIVVDTSSLADSENTPKSATQTGEKISKKNKKKSKQAQQQVAESFGANSTPSPQITKKSPMISNVLVQQNTSAYASTSHNAYKGIKESMTASNGGSTAGDLNSGPQVLIKNINGRVVITPVHGTDKNSISSEKVDLNSKSDRSKSIYNQSKTVSSTQTERNINVLNDTSSGAHRTRKQLNVPIDSFAQQNSASNMSFDDKLQSNRISQNTTNIKSQVSTFNGIDITNQSQNLKNENIKLASKVKKTQPTHDNKHEFLSNQIHNKHSKSVNDVENLGGKRRSKKNSIGDNFEDLSKYFNEAYSSA